MFFGDNIMGKNVLKILLIVVFFPVTIIFFIAKKIYNVFYNNILSSYLNDIDISSIDALSGVEFEELVYYLFKNLGFRVTKTNKSHDYGADLILEINNEKIVLQCKLYYNHSVGISAIQEVYSATKHYGANLGVVLTNSTFSKSAKTLAENTSVLLWDRSMLIHLLKLKKDEKIMFKKKLMLLLN